MVGFLRERGETWTAFNPRGGCWFLQSDGWCRIERERGRDAKPAACRLFPFNRVFRLGGWTVVDYNSVICPLEAHPPEVNESEVGLSGRIAHRDVLDDLNAVQDPAVVGIALDVQRIQETPQAFLEREERIRAACFAHAERLLSGELEPAAAMRKVFVASTGRAQALEAELGAWAKWLLGEELRVPTPKQLRRALLLTPSMRFNEVFGPRSWVNRHIHEAELAAMWRVWIHFVACGEELANQPLTLQQATSLWGGQVALMAAAALWGHAPVLEDGPIEVATQGQRAEHALALARAMHANAAARESLGDLCTRVWSGLDASERVVLSRHLESWMERIAFQPARASATDRRARRKRRKR